MGYIFGMKNTDSNDLEVKENLVELVVDYGPERDILRVKNAIKRLPWYEERGYNIATIKLPAGLSESSTQEEIETAVLVEYREEEYKNFEAFIKEKWDEFSKCFEELKNVPSLNLRDKYTVVLTRYGMSGSYDERKGEVIINLGRREKEQTVGIIFHEITHMTIEALIQKYQVGHWYKERLVDLMMDKYFTGLKDMQMIKEDVGAVDKAFNAFFPDFEAITRAIGEKQ